jgi:hypothetical protein
MPTDPRSAARQDALDHRGGLLGAYRLHGNGLGTSVAWDAIEADPLGDAEDGDLWIHLERTAPEGPVVARDARADPEGGVARACSATIRAPG